MLKIEERKKNVHSKDNYIINYLYSKLNLQFIYLHSKIRFKKYTALF